MKRLFWFGLGAAAGVALTRKAAHTARQATPAGLAANVSDALRELAGAVGAFGADVRAGMSERERELHEVVEHRTGPDAGRSARATARGTLESRRSDGYPQLARDHRRPSGARARRAGG
ncbi:hypothetical protein GCM10012275_48930 [Longimycelium tulufanense]|uniref:Secreted protein n=1 Tax=Longimycelium tulufanense TaxID=907463 RepID=A0A8J3CIP2_9PSEU|nr:hypothetical protein [Longimycelium tulufanense]GGM72530.1 hypothetical protein GCM10012275_48930 [Longimycelium tulufanense]